jgi:hypothetical protein
MQPSPNKADRHLGSCSRGANPKRSTRNNSPHGFFIAASSIDNHPLMLVVFDLYHLLHLTPCLNINITYYHFPSSHLVSSPLSPFQAYPSDPHNFRKPYGHRCTSLAI